jgi:hypothetical protein
MTLVLLEFANTFPYRAMMTTTVLLTRAMLYQVATTRQLCAMITTCVLTMHAMPPRMAIALSFQLTVMTDWHAPLILVLLIRAALTCSLFVTTTTLAPMTRV